MQMTNKEALSFLVENAIKNYEKTGFGMTKYKRTTVIADCVPDGMRVAVYESGFLMQQYIRKSA